jgi:RNA-directed DNA polymerase
MKRVGNLFEQIVERENLRLALHKAMKGKRDRAEVRSFTANVDERLEAIARGLRDSSYPLGQFRQFVIHDKKERIITAPCFAERVIHHAIMNVCEPHFDRWLIHDSYACRKGKGRIAALQRAREFAANHAFFLKMDVRKYFDSISHTALPALLARRFKDTSLLGLFARVVRGFRGALGRGLPIGSLMSQHFANFYLCGLDRIVKEGTLIGAYVRYMDDMALWAEDKKSLQGALHAMARFMGEELGLEPKPTPYLNRTRHGMEFLGCRVFADRMVLTARNRTRFRRRLTRLEQQFADGTIGEPELQQRGMPLTAFANTAGLCGWRFRSRVLQQVRGSGLTARTG